MTTSTTHQPDVVRNANDADLIAHVATRLGFNPHDSLVLASIRPGGRIGLITRLNLPDVTAQATRQTSALLAKDGAGMLVAIVYTDDASKVRPALNVVQAVAHVRVLEMHVTATSYRRVGQEPHPITEVHTSRAAMARILHGRRVRTRREDLAPTARPQDACTARVAQRLAPATTPEQAREAWQQAVARDEHDPNVLGTLAAALGDVHNRDAVLTFLVADVAGTGADAGEFGALVFAPGGVEPGNGIDPWIKVLGRVAAQTNSAAAWTLWAICHWWAGRGATANIGIERATSADPTHGLAILLAKTLNLGIGPGWTQAPRP